MKNEDRVLELLSELLRRADKQDEILKKHTELLERHGEILENQTTVLERHGEILENQTKILGIHAEGLEHVYVEQKGTNTKLDKISDQLGELNRLMKEEVFRRLNDLEIRMAAMERK